MFAARNASTNSLKASQKSLYTVLYMGLIVILFTCLIDVSLGFSNLMMLAFLWCAAAYFNHILLVFVVILMLATAVQYSMALGIITQVYLIKHEYFIRNKHTTIIYSAMLAFVIIYNIIAIRASFRAYRVFKYHALGAFVPSARQDAAHAHVDNDEGAHLLTSNRDEENNRRGFMAFGGSGVRIG